MRELNRRKDMSDRQLDNNSMLERFLSAFERVANKLPTPFTIFAILFTITAIISVLMSGTTAISPATGEEVITKNFFSAEGIQWLLENLVRNFTGYAPLGVVLVMTIAIGLCEEVGFLTHLIKSAMRGMPISALPYFTIMIGIIGQTASDSAQLLVPPLAASIYLAAGRHPVVGLLTAFAGVGLGYLANPMITTTDVLTSGITNSVLDNFIPGMRVEVIGNHYFKIVSFFFLAVVLGFVSDKYIEPRWGKYTGKALHLTENTNSDEVTPEMKKGMKWAKIATLAYVLLIIAGMLAPGVLLNPETGLIGSPFLSGIVPIVFGLLVSAGLAYGFGSGALVSEASVGKTIAKQMAGMGGYLAMAFTAAQFTSLFTWSNIGTILSISGAKSLEAAGFVGAPLFVTFIIFVVLLDYLISSSSAKWTILAPIFVPMFGYLGYHPAFSQLAYRIGDAGANILGPLNVFLWLLLDISKERYDDSLKIGNFLSTLFVFMIVAMIGFIIIFLIWMTLGLPVGPGSPVHITI